tara:strand:+ start:1654 stop:2442 length:789 start_codon:yes stop_codon:yes gene_type:complete
MNSSLKILDRGMSNEFLMNIIKGMIGAYIVFVPQKIAASLVNLIDNMVVRIIGVVLISLIAVKDVGLALFIALALIITLHSANSGRILNLQNSLTAFGDNGWFNDIKALFGITSSSSNKENDEKETDTENDTVESDSENDNENDNEENNNQIDDSELENTGSENNQEDADESDKEVESYDNFKNTFKNLPDSIPLKSEPILINGPVGFDNNMNNNNAVFTNEIQLTDAQVNSVAGSNQASCLSTFENSHCAGGLFENIPNGY